MIDRATKPISKIQQGMTRFTKITGRQVIALNQKMAQFSGAAISRVGTVAVGGLSLALADGARKAIDFEQTLVNASAKFPSGIKKGTEAFNALERAARKTGATTEFTSIQSAEALNFLAMAGFNAEQSIAALPGIVDLATAAQVDLAEATDIATDSLGAFGLATKDPTKLAANLARVNDVLAKTTTTANTNMEAMFETIKTGGPVATSAGASIETFAAFTGKLANAGIKGEQAGTTLKNVFLNLAGQTPKATKALKTLGVTTTDQAGNLRDVIDIFEDINKGIQREKLGTAETAAVLKDIFGKIPIAGVNVLLKEGADNLRQYRKELEGATGASSAMAKQMRDTLKGAINSLLSAFEGLQITIFKLNDGSFAGLVERVTGVIRGLDEWIQKNQELAKGIVEDVINALSGVLKIMGLIIVTFTAWKIGVLAMNAVMIGFNAVLLISKGILLGIKAVIIAVKIAQIAWNLAMSLNPIGVIIALVGALVIAGELLLQNWDSVADFFVNLWDQIGSAFSTGIDFVMGIIKPFQQAISGIGGLFEKFGISFGGTETQGGGTSPGAATSPQVVTQAATTRALLEQRTEETSRAEVLIKDETGRGQLTTRGSAPGVKISMINSGDG